MGGMRKIRIIIVSPHLTAVCSEVAVSRLPLQLTDSSVASAYSTIL